MQGLVLMFVVHQLEELMNTLERTRQELDATKQRLSSTQQSLQERDTHLTNMRQERRKQLEEILEMKLVTFDISFAKTAHSFTSLYVFVASPWMDFFFYLKVRDRAIHLYQRTKSHICILPYC